MSKLMREVLYGDDQEVLQSALRGESGTLDILEELFGDEAHTFTSQPEITTAPGGSDDDADGDGSDYDDAEGDYGNGNDRVDETDLLVWAEPKSRQPPILAAQPAFAALSKAETSATGSALTEVRQL